MKLLGWMHSMFRQNSDEPFAIINGLGHPCTCLSKQASFDEQLQEQQQYYYPKANTCSSKPSCGNNLPRKENLMQKSFAGMDSFRIEENLEYFTYDGHDSPAASVAISGLFDGLLNIGTLGLGQHQLASEPETPTFGVENATEKEEQNETEFTENDLMLVNEELEKVLSADAKNEDDRFYCKDSSSAKTDNDSAITLGGSTGQVVNGNDGGKQTPLQGYLFGSPVQSTTGSRREHRPSLGELFQMNKLGEGKNNNCNEDYHKRHAAGGNYKPVKKFHKWRALKSTSPTTASVSAEKKLQKLLQIFSRKVHPESSAATQRSQKSHKNESKNNTSIAPSYRSNYYHGNNAARSMTDEDIVLFPPHETQREGTMKEDHILCHNNHSNSPPFEVNRSVSSGNRECWIKTDADYLVLEL